MERGALPRDHALEAQALAISRTHPRILLPPPPLALALSLFSLSRSLALLSLSPSPSLSLSLSLSLPLSLPLSLAFFSSLSLPLSLCFSPSTPQVCERALESARRRPTPSLPPRRPRRGRKPGPKPLLVVVAPSSSSSRRRHHRPRASLRRVAAARHARPLPRAPRRARGRRSSSFVFVSSSSFVFVSSSSFVFVSSSSFVFVSRLRFFFVSSSLFSFLRWFRFFVFVGARRLARPGWPCDRSGGGSVGTHCGGRYATRRREAWEDPTPPRTRQHNQTDGRPSLSCRRSSTARLAVVRRLRWRGGGAPDDDAAARG